MIIAKLLLVEGNFLSHVVLVGKHETFEVLGVGSSPTVGISRGDSLKTHSLGDLRMPSKIGGVKKE